MTPFELWKNFIDSFANLHDGVHKNWVIEKGAYPDRPENEDKNIFLCQLSFEQRQILAEMLIDARRGGVHDALVILNDRMALNSGSYLENGIEMEFQPFGSEIYYDYIGRRMGEDWPKDDS